VVSVNERQATGFSWQILARPSRTEVTFAGVLDEQVNLEPLRTQLIGSVVFHLRGLQRVNSMGALTWQAFVRGLPDVTELSFIHCSPAFITQLNLFHGFAGAGHVETFYAPYWCPGCKQEELVLCRAGEIAIDNLPERSCVNCGEPMKPDELPERYLAFLKPRTEPFVPG
jgi:hypothetical protein